MVIIKQEDNEYFIYSVTNTPFFMNGWQNMKYYFKHNKIIPFDLPIDEEIDLYFQKTRVGNVDRKDFTEVHRIDMHGAGDIVTYVYNGHLNLYNREKKLERILNF